MILPQSLLIYYAMDWVKASDIQKRIEFLISELNLTYIKPNQIICFRSTGSASRARARIWSFPKIWQLALDLEPHYCLEVISHYFDKMSLSDQEKVLIHELLHIPKNFSGSLVPHRTHKRRTFRHYHDEVETLYRRLTKYSFE